MTQRIRNAMVLALHRGECRDSCGEINYTTLAETAAYDCDHLEWLDDPTHEVWDHSIDIADNWGTT